MKDPAYEAGLAVRRRVLGDAHVTRSLANATSFDEDLQDLVTRHAWGDIWTRPGLDHRTRSLITIAMLAAGGRDEELKLHVRATRNTGATADEVKEVLLQVAVYAGRACGGFRVPHRKSRVRGNGERGRAMILPAGYRRESPTAHPPLRSSCVREHPQACAATRADPDRAHAVGNHRTALRARAFEPGDDDLTHFNGGEALGERIIVTGRVLDEDGRAIPDTLIEIWQANAAGRYAHDADQHDAPLDPHFAGIGRVITDDHGAYRFMTVKPGAYPWRNHHNAWRPASHSLQPVRAELRHSPHHADVFSRRSAAGARSDLQQRPRPFRARATDRYIRYRSYDSRATHSVIDLTSCCEAATRLRR